MDDGSGRVYDRRCRAERHQRRQLLRGGTKGEPRRNARRGRAAHARRRAAEGPRNTRPVRCVREAGRRVEGRASRFPASSAGSGKKGGRARRFDQGQRDPPVLRPHGGGHRSDRRGQLRQVRLLHARHPNSHRLGGRAPQAEAGLPAGPALALPEVFQGKQEVLPDAAVRASPPSRVHLGPEMAGERPRVSIVTVTLNSREHVEDAIRSVLSQTYPAIEYVIIDGGSTDGTLDVIRAHEKDFASWISEPDRGIADAFNKGLAATSGDYVLFLNSDDWLADPEALSR